MWHERFDCREQKRRAWLNLHLADSTHIHRQHPSHRIDDNLGARNRISLWPFDRLHMTFSRRVDWRLISSDSTARDGFSKFLVRMISKESTVAHMRCKSLNLTLCERFRADLAEEWPRFVGGFPSSNCWHHLNLWIHCDLMRLNATFWKIR